MKYLLDLFREIVDGVKRGIFPKKYGLVRNKKDAKSWRNVKMDGFISYVSYGDDDRYYLLIQGLNDKRNTNHFPISPKTYHKLKNYVGYPATIVGIEYLSHNGRIAYTWDSYIVDNQIYNKFD